MNEHDAIEELAALLDGDGDVDSAPGSLGALLTLAQTVRDTTELTAPTPEFRASLRDELVAAVEPTPTLVERARAAWVARTSDLRTSARVAVATMTASSMIGSAGVAVAAQEALPGEFLYGVKGLTEQARLLLATDDVAEARLHLAFARERLEELEASAGTLTVDEIVALLDRMDESSQAGAEALLDGLAAGAIDADEIRAFTDGQRDGIVRVFGDLPLLAKPVAEDSLELLRRIAVNATAVREPSAASAQDCDCDDGLFGRLSGDSRSGPAAPDAQAPPRTTTTPRTTAISVPGEGPAVADTDCDCIELPGGTEAREPDTATGTADDEAGDEQQQEPEEEPFQPSGTLISPEAGGEEEDDERDSDTDVTTSVDQLPLDDASETVEDGTGVTVDSGPLDRTTEGVDDLLD